MDSIGPPLDFDPQPAERPRTSGFAVASLVSSLVGLVTCCAFVPSILGIIFGGIAWGPIQRQELRGRGLALSGIILGVLGLVAGLVLVIAVQQSPGTEPVPGDRVTPAQRAALESMSVLQPGEPIELLYAEGTWSVKEGGVVITKQRLVRYTPDGPAEAWPLAEVAAIAFEPAASFIDVSQFVVERDGGELMIFSLSGSTAGGQTFNRVLTQLAAAARQQAGKPPPARELSHAEAE